MAGGEDLLGLRIAATMIDLAILLVVSVVLGVTIGEASVEGASFSYNLGGSDVAAFLALAFVYYFAFEATIGRTIGKLLLGLKVISEDGDRADAPAVLVRTVLRVVDWLPLMYLTGFIAAMATGVRRQRLGDIAAETVVVRAPPIRRRGTVAALLGVFLVAVLGVSVFSVAASDEASTTFRAPDDASITFRAPDDASTTFRADGVSFDYPADWFDATGDVTSDVEGTSSEIAFVGVGEHDLVVVSTWRTDLPVTAQNLDLAAEDLTATIRGWPGWTLEAGPEETTIGGMPALRYEATGTAGGDDVRSTFVFAFDGRTEYELNCQSTPEQAAEIQKGCDQIHRTFKVE